MDIGPIVRVCVFYPNMLQCDNQVYVNVY